MANRFYNTERKQAFIVSYATKKDELGNPIVDPENATSYIYNHSYFVKTRAIFNKLGQIESHYNKDFCEINPETDQDMIQDIYLNCFINRSDCGSRFDNAILRSYLSWSYNSGYISADTYQFHPFLKKFKTNFKRNGSDKDTKTLDIRGERINKTINTIKDVDCESVVELDYVFRTPDDFFSYIKELFSSDVFAMQAAACCLLYYGFKSDEIFTIKRIDVVDEDQSVCQQYIDNPIAFDLILRAKHITTFKTGGTKKRQEQTYNDSIYLLRSNRKNEVDIPVNSQFFFKIYKKEEDAAELLPITSPYKNIRIKLNTIKKLQGFHCILKDSEEYGESYVATKFKNNEYRYGLDYQTYLLMLAKSNKL